MSKSKERPGYWRNIKADDDIELGDWCFWWIIAGDGRSSASRVHVPADIIDGDRGRDPDVEPEEAETLCHTSDDHKVGWRPKSHALLPPGFKKECEWCKKRITSLRDQLEPVKDTGQ